MSQTYPETKKKKPIRNFIYTKYIKPRYKDTPRLQTLYSSLIFFRFDDALKVLKRGNLRWTRRQIQQEINRRINLRSREKYGMNWTKKRRKYLRVLYPQQKGRCAMCRKHIPYLQMTIDHIQRVVVRPDLVHDITNMQLLCKPCHKKKTLFENAMALRHQLPC